MKLRELITQHCADMTDYEQIAALLNAPTVVDNPQKEAYDVPAPPTLDDVLAIVPSAERVKIRALSGYVDDVRRAIDTGNTLYMQTLIEDALTAQAISAGTAGKLAELLQRTAATTAETVCILKAATTAFDHAVLNNDTPGVILFDAQSPLQLRVLPAATAFNLDLSAAHSVQVVVRYLVLDVN